MARLVDPADPRLALRPGPASPQDAMTAAAIRLLGDALGRHGSGLLAAPAVGVPVQLIGLREGDVTTYLLNPRLCSLGPLRLVLAETSALTGPVRRTTERAAELAFDAQDLSGAPKRIALRDGLAIAAQQAFELLGGHLPTDWLTAFHLGWLSESDPARRALFDQVNAALCGGVPSESPCANARWGAGTLHLAGPNRVAVGGGDTIAWIDAADPLAPVLPHHQALMALLGALPVLRAVVFADPATLGLVLAVVLRHPGALAHLLTRPEPWPDAALAELGLDPVLRRLATGAGDFAMPQAGAPPVQAIVLDRVACASGPVPDVAALRAMLRALDGPSGALLWAVPQADAGVEDRLQAVFPVVQAVGAPGALIYAAFKSPFNAAAARARIFARANASRSRGGLAVLSQPWLALRKDGGREAL